MRSALRSVRSPIHYRSTAATVGGAKAIGLSATHDYRSIGDAVHKNDQGAEGDLCATHRDGAPNYVSQENDARSTDHLYGPYCAQSESGVQFAFRVRTVRDLPANGVPAEATDRPSAAAA